MHQYEWRDRKASLKANKYEGYAWRKTMDRATGRTKNPAINDMLSESNCCGAKDKMKIAIGAMRIRRKNAVNRFRSVRDTSIWVSI